MMTPFNYEVAIEEERMTAHVLRSLADDFARQGKPDECHAAHVDADYHWHRAADLMLEWYRFEMDFLDSELALVGAATAA